MGLYVKIYWRQIFQTLYVVMMKTNADRKLTNEMAFVCEEKDGFLQHQDKSCRLKTEGKTA